MPAPTQRNVEVQLGVHFEEVVEMLNEIHTNDESTLFYLLQARKSMGRLADFFKKGEVGSCALRNPEAFLDSICDQIVTATGCAHMLGYDVCGAMDEVNESNFSKFDESGAPIFDQSGKIVKGPNYRKPDLSPFV